MREIWQLHPAWLVALFLVMNLGGIAILSQPIVGVMIYSLSWIGLVVWLHSIYAFSRVALIRRGLARRDFSWVFLIAAVGPPFFWILQGLVMAGYPEWLTASHPSQILGAPVMIALFGAFALTAFELVYAETGERPSAFGGAVAWRFLLLFYFPIGAWFIRPRLRRIHELS